MTGLIILVVAVIALVVLLKKGKDPRPVRLRTRVRNPRPEGEEVYLRNPLSRKERSIPLNRAAREAEMERQGRPETARERRARVRAEHKEGMNRLRAQEAIRQAARDRRDG